jgi:thiol-disulfide isomerase/thioredoxin
MDALRGEDWLVVCLCAAWCGSCRDYRETFARLAREHADTRFAWVDIEDQSDALAPFDLDIEDFPTLLIARGDELRFLGVLTPHAATLKRTLLAARSTALVEYPADWAAGLVATLRELGEPAG